MTPLHLAAIEGHGTFVDILLELGAPVNQPDNKGRVPMHCAAMRGRAAIVQSLLAAGGEASIQDDSGKTAADVAVEAAVQAVLRDR